MNKIHLSFVYKKLGFKDKCHLKVKGWEMYYKQIKLGSKQVLLAYHPTKTDFKLKVRERGHFILIKGTINQEKIIILNIYAQNSDVHNFIKIVLLELNHRLIPTQ